MANRFPPCLFPLPISSPLRSLLSPLILSHPGTDVHLLKVAHDGIGQRRMRKEEAATHGGGCVDLLHCAMHEEGGGSGWDKASKQNFYGCWHMRHRRLRFVLRRSNWSSNI
uniref:Uncharacterized protein n=1 Tax=Oryza rufipogon TaxID=4529 RepID=A0A0E0QXT7_ORYRU